MQPILEIQNIGKKYNIRHENLPYLNLRDTIQNIFLKKKKTEIEEFWALKDVSFDVYPGDTIGIIGRNGAGKSTLLKILSKITPPSTGKIITRGRIASLLEVGTGFHNELSGKENIYLNGSILGMKQKEISSKFDQIVDFSGVEKFLDTPLKHYSSGMQLRLAFAVAAFLDPEILVIDEVLAVGDLEFQNKCLGKMDEVSKSGRTILFVNHNLESVQKLCKKGIVIDSGKIQFIGDADSAIKNYVSKNKENATHSSTKQINKFDNNNRIFVKEISLYNASGELANVFNVGEKWTVKVKYRVEKPVNHLIIAIGLMNVSGVKLNSTWSSPYDLNEGEYETSFTNDLLVLCPDFYKITLGISLYEQAIIYEPDIMEFNTIDINIKDLDKRIVRTKNIGLILNQLSCTNKKL